MFRNTEDCSSDLKRTSKLFTTEAQITDLEGSKGEENTRIADNELTSDLGNSSIENVTKGIRIQSSILERIQKLNESFRKDQEAVNSSEPKINLKHITKSNLENQVSARIGSTVTNMMDGSCVSTDGNELHIWEISEKIYAIKLCRNQLNQDGNLTKIMTALNKKFNNNSRFLVFVRMLSKLI